MRFWRLKAGLVVALIVDFAVSFYIVVKLYEFELIHGDSVVLPLLVFVSMGLFIILGYLFKRGIIFSTSHFMVGAILVGGDPYFKPSKDFYAHFSLIFIFVATVFLGSIYLMLKGY